MSYTFIRIIVNYTFNHKMVNVAKSNLTVINYFILIKKASEYDQEITQSLQTNQRHREEEPQSTICQKTSGSCSIQFLIIYLNNQ